MTPTHDAAQLLSRALGKIPSGVFILCAGRGEEATAMLASWVQQAGFDPPAVSVALAKGRPAARIVRQSRVFSLCIVPESDTALMKRYARPTPGASAFAGIPTQIGHNGVPLLCDALAAVECELLTLCDTHSDHEIAIGQVIAGHLFRDGRPFTHVRGNGMKY